MHSSCLIKTGKYPDNTASANLQLCSAFGRDLGNGGYFHEAYPKREVKVLKRKRQKQSYNVFPL